MMKPPFASCTEFPDIARDIIIMHSCSVLIPRPFHPNIVTPRHGRYTIAGDISITLYNAHEKFPSSVGLILSSSLTLDILLYKLP